MAVCGYWYNSNDICCLLISWDLDIIIGININGFCRSNGIYCTDKMCTDSWLEAETSSKCQYWHLKLDVANYSLIKN